MREYEALVDRKRAADMRERLNFGFIYAAIHNCAPFADANRKPVQPEDIVPGLAKQKPAETGFDLTKLSSTEQAAHFKKLFPKAVVKKRNG